MLLEKITELEKRYNELNQALMKVGNDYQKAAALNKERSDLEDLVKKGQEYRTALQNLEEARFIAENESDPEMKELAASEISQLEARIPQLEHEIKRLLLPKDPRDDKNVIIEIRAGAGGDEAGLFAAEIFRMYTRYAERQGWKVEIMSMNETGIGGIKEVVALIKGQGAYSKLKYESGVHRVQRIPATESSGRIHTSTVTVAVLAEVDEVEIEIPNNDIKIDVYKSAGAGGQNVQKNSTAVRITHLPTGIVVACQDERSQLQNRLRALAILRARLYAMEEEKRRSEQDASRRSQVGSGERSEKIRTYNFPQSRVTDHRINLSLYNLDAVLQGEIDPFIEELATRDEVERLTQAGLDTT